MPIQVTSAVHRAIFTLFLALAIALVLVACGDGGTSTGAVSQPTETPISSPTTAEKSEDEPTEAAPDGWLTYTSEADGFSVDMPGEPQTSTQSMDSALGELTFYFFQLTQGDGFYMVSYNDYPIEMTEDDLDPESVLQEGIDATAQGGEVQNVQRIEVQGNPGIEGEINLQGTTHIWYKSVLVKHRLYQMVMTAPEAEKGEFAGEALRFRESFRLLK